jgi:4-hydroxy-tetrahydrodipicolinate synthase
MPRFAGALAAAVTPSRPDTYQMDISAALEVVDFLCSHDIRGVVMFGATGEFPHFSVEERFRLTHMAVKRSRVPVLVNVTHSCYEQARALVEHAVDNGVAGVLLQPPHYFRYEPAEIRQFYSEILNEWAQRVPILLYNLPAFNNAIPIEVACELLTSGAAAGIKDSSGDVEYLQSLLGARSTREFPLLVGNDALLIRGLRSGADGFVSGCAAAVPELLVALDKAIAQKSEQRIEVLGALLDEFLERIAPFPGPMGIRECLAARGLKIGARAVPFSPQTDVRAAGLREWIKAWLPIMQREASHA